MPAVRRSIFLPFGEAKAYVHSFELKVRAVIVGLV
jgi:hypothetical protein